ncbi:MAG: hypothetical protein KBS72_03700 [Bacteroidales bacterium]|nr:hypothetical protein [Candidatus Cacconaster scatequi]
MNSENCGDIPYVGNPTKSKIDLCSSKERSNITDKFKKILSGWDSNLFIKLLLLIIAVSSVINTILLSTLVVKTFDVHVNNTVDTYIEGGSVDVSGSVDCDNIDDLIPWMN